MGDLSTYLFAGNGVSEGLGAFPNEVLELEHDSLALLDGHLAPGFEGGLSSTDRGVELYVYIGRRWVDWMGGWMGWVG